MDKVLFIVGDTPITLEMAVYAGAALIAVLLIALVVTIFRQAQLRNEAALEAASAAADQLRANFIEQVAGRDSRIRELDQALSLERQRSEDLLGMERDKNADLRSELAAMRTRLDEQARQNELNLKRYLDARQQMTDEFKLIAGEVLQVHSETFTKQNREQVDVLLKPLHEKITEFHQGLIKDRSAMSEQIRALAESNLQITTEAHNLTRALKGNSQTQGAWGEMILSTILEQSGLREGEQFITQTSHSGEDGQRVRTDVEVLMPNNDRLIIDSKVSLTAFEAYVNCEDETREMHLRAHIASVRNHISTLGDKAYHRAAKSSMDYVMMFVPIEAAQTLVLCEAVHAHRRVRYTVAFLSGLRDGELQGLTWGDIHLDEPVPYLEVRQAFALKASPEKYADLTDPKTPSSLRAVPLHEAAIAALRWWRAVGWEFYVGRNHGPTDAVFASVNGAHWRPKSAREFREDLSAAGQARETKDGDVIDFHATRRSFSTWLGDHGAEPETIDRMLGHRGKTTRSRHYTAAVLSRYAAALALLPFRWQDPPGHESFSTSDNPHNAHIVPAHKEEPETASALVAQWTEQRFPKPPINEQETRT